MWSCEFRIQRCEGFSTVIASAAKQSIYRMCWCMDCFVAEFIIGPAEGRTRWLLAMTRGWPMKDEAAGLECYGFSMDCS